MCGIAGLLDTGAATPPEALKAEVRRLTDAIAHRGPDDSGAWVDPAAGIGLGHRRLAIIDLSPAGHQPMASASERFVLVFNGEIYNFDEVRSELEREGRAPAWRGRSDTEVMLAAMDAWGVEAALPRFRGMFAFAAWDRRERQLWLVRDRLGKKPLYYGRFGDRWLFGSELAALEADRSFAGTVDRAAIVEMLRRNAIPQPRSIWREVRQVPPGGWVRVGPGGLVGPRRWWSPRPGPPVAADDAEARVAEVLESAVRERTVSDVPLGALLSGGIDSSVVTALLQRVSSRPVRTFTVGYREGAYDEARFAREVAKHLGTEHTDLVATPQDAIAVVPELARIYGEPFGDSSAIPTVLVSRLARRHVTVCLSGDGGDEAFGGYTRYVETLGRWKRLSRVPGAIRRSTARAMRAAAARADTARSERLYRHAVAVDATSFDAFYQAQLAQTAAPESWVVGGEPAPEAEVPTDRADPCERMMAADLVGYLPSDVLVKVDRASMSCALEMRAPLLDHRVIELALALPLSMRIGDGEQKRVLKRIAERHVPKALLDRPKMGFGVPLDTWLKGPLRDWAEPLVSERAVADAGLLVPAVVRARWEAFVSGRAPWNLVLWSALMVQAWAAGRRGAS